MKLFFADKTRNKYQINQKNYKKLLANHSTKTYRISNKNLFDQKNAESEKTIIDRNSKKKKTKFSTRTLKDHKKQNPFDIKCKFLNPGKNELGRISKNI